MKLSRLMNATFLIVINFSYFKVDFLPPGPLFVHQQQTNPSCKMTVHILSHNYYANYTLYGTIHQTTTNIFVCNNTHASPTHSLFRQSSGNGVKLQSVTGILSAFLSHNLYSIVHSLSQSITIL
eukprot:m.198836 g.198836  ORF g.198836 m.198836 type:complete len:124 (+) comp15720_c1_seq9:666-1037(+)